MSDLSSLTSSGLSLAMGNQGPGVLALQVALKKVGFALSGTGYFGAATDTAVMAFQRRLGLTPDGVVGPQTAASLDLVVGQIVKTGVTSAPLGGSPPEEIGRPLWLEAGIKLIGTKEGPGAKDNPLIIEWAKDLGGDIAGEYTHDSIPWCALFANHCLSAAGIKGTGSLWALDFAGKWPSVRLAGPAVGAFAPMLRNGGGHIIQVVGRDLHGRVMGLGGNQSDAVNIEAFTTTRLNHGFWWPKGVRAPDPVGYGTLPVVTGDGKVSTNEA